MGRYGFFISSLYHPSLETLGSFGRCPKDRFADIEMDWTVENTSPTTHTGHLTEMLRIIVKLMH
jgi:hypothetical protein